MGMAAKARFFAALAVAVACVAAAAADDTPVVYVSPFGADSNDGSAERPVQHIKRAVSMTSNGGRVLLYPGVYSGTDNEAVVLPANVQLRAARKEDRDATVLRCNAMTYALRIEQDNVTVADLVVRECNTAFTVVPLNKDASVHISNVLFQKNDYGVETRTASGTGLRDLYIYMNSCSFEGSKKSAVFISRKLAADYGKLTQVNISNSVFLDSAVGVTIDERSFARLYVSSSMFAGNAVAIDAEADLLVEITHSRFDRNGPLALGSTGTNALVDISGTVFYDNAASDGAVLTSRGKKLLINSTVFTQNTGTGYAGALDVQSSEAVLDQVSFTDNMVGDDAQDSAGAIHFARSSKQAAVRTSDFKRNRGSAAGGILCDGSSVFLQNVLFEDNTANGGSGPGSSYACGGSCFVTGVDVKNVHNSPGDAC